jgi:hypothetical protein
MTPNDLTPEEQAFLKEAETKVINFLIEVQDRDTARRQWRFACLVSWMIAICAIIQATFVSLHHCV